MQVYNAPFKFFNRNKLNTALRCEKVDNTAKSQLNMLIFSSHFKQEIPFYIKQKLMKLKDTVISRVPRPSRSFQVGILFHIEHRFDELIQVSYSSPKLIKEKIQKSKALLLDIRHIILYQSFDYDMREKIAIRADAILNYINYYTKGLKRKNKNIN